MKPIRKLFSKNLKCLRKRRNLTQEELAEILGISARYLQQLERKNCPSVGIDKIAALAKSLRARPKEFFED